MDTWVTPAICGLWALFLGSHVGLSSLRLRPRLVSRLGANGFLATYSIIALAIFVPLVWIYFSNKHAGPFLWYGSPIALVRPTSYILMGIAFTLVIGSFLNPSPASIAPSDGRIRGVLRVTRHPLFMGVSLFGVLHLLMAQIYASDLAFFGGLPVVGLIGCWHQDRRKLADDSESFQGFYDSTAFLPFASGGFRGLFEAPLALGLGIIATVVLRMFHPNLFGGAP